MVSLSAFRPPFLSYYPTLTSQSYPLHHSSLHSTVVLPPPTLQSFPPIIVLFTPPIVPPPHVQVLKLAQTLIFSNIL